MLDRFLAEATAFLDAHASRRPQGARFEWGEGDDSVALFEDLSPEEEAARVVEAKDWAAARFDAGFGWIAGPEAYGGRDLPRELDRSYHALEATYAVPGGDVFVISLGMVAPTILAHGSDEAKQRFLRGLHRGELIACQLFSEPGAGSDLASVATTAVRDGDDWVLTGQKVWTSGAQHADIGEILCRTDPAAPKHEGITAFVVDMRAPGVTVRPLRQMTGQASFSEVFLDEVRVPGWARLGDVGGGWAVALTTLRNERGAVNAKGAGSALTGTNLIVRLIELLRTTGRADDAVARQELARLYARFQVAKWNYQRAMARIRAGEAPGPELSGAKLARSQNLAAAAELVGRVLGPRLAADGGGWGTYAWNGLLLAVPGLRLAGGTDEIQRTIIAERVLGLPKEPVPRAAP